MRKLFKISQIGFTYIGTVVGAGFASGQEIMQFFTLYGVKAYVGIGITSIFFVWAGCRMMLISKRIKAYSYQDLNNYLFGQPLGKVVNFITLLILFGVTTVMLAGTGSIFEEQLHLPFQIGILFTLVLTYFVMNNGMNAIMTVNSFIVPAMFIFTAILFGDAWSSHGIFLPKLINHDWHWLTSPIIYVSYNLAMAQAILVPLGKEIDDDRMLKWGGLVGAIGIGLMLAASNYALSSHLPNIQILEIPMGMLVMGLGTPVHLLFIFVIYGEIFTTLIANVYGLSRQAQQWINAPQRYIVAGILGISYLISQIGFSSLLQWLYPLFGYVGLALLFMVMLKRHRNH